MIVMPSRSPSSVALQTVVYWVRLGFLLAKLDKEVRNNCTMASTDSPSSNPQPDLKVKVEENNLPEITSPDWKAVVFTDEEINVIDNAAVLDAKINEFWSSLFQRTQPPVFGVDVKDSFDEDKARKLELLVLCGWNSFLIIQLQILSSFPECLKNYFADESVCFVGFQGSTISLNIYCVLSDLAKEVSVDYVEATSTSNGTSTDWKAIAFTDEVIMSAIQKAYRCYDLGNKLLTMVA
ncbi:hypothetical protein QYF36_007727 [Acer negundo]|nr:hypothetical protein QYF36_007727 [Acer negundo]